MYVRITAADQARRKIDTGTSLSKHVIDSFVAKSAYIWTAPISSDGIAEARTARACEVVCLIPIKSVILYF